MLSLSVFVVCAQYKFPLPPGYEAIIPTLNDNSRSHNCYHDGQYHSMHWDVHVYVLPRPPPFEASRWKRLNPPNHAPNSIAPFTAIAEARKGLGMDVCNNWVLVTTQCNIWASLFILQITLGFAIDKVEIAVGWNMKFCSWPWMYTTKKN